MQFLKKRKALLAVCNGECRPLSAIPDEAFASGMLGVGYAIEPTDGRFYAPVDGKITSVSKTRHAYTILSSDGIDILVHIGVDTVRMGGKGFTSLVKEGDRVKAGSPIAEVDLAAIRARDLPTITAVLITDPREGEAFDFQYGKAVGGKDAVLARTDARKG